MKKLIFVGLLLLSISCVKSSQPKNLIIYNHTFYLNIIYQNGEIENLTYKTEGSENVELYLNNCGCIIINDNHELITIRCGVRKLELITKNKRIKI